MATLGKSTITELSLLNALAIKDGGTGATTFTSGAAIIGNGTSAFSTKAITDNTTATAVAASANLITANTLYYHKGNSNIVTVGTITSGTWQGTKIANAYLANSKVTVAGKDISLGGSLSVADLKTALGLNNVTNTAASGYLTALSSNTTNAVSITVGGTTKNITTATMKSSLGLGALAYKASLGKADVGLGNVENTALSSWAGSTSLTTCAQGTIIGSSNIGSQTVSHASTAGNIKDKDGDFLISIGSVASLDYSGKTYSFGQTGVPCNYYFREMNFYTVTAGTNTQSSVIRLLNNRDVQIFSDNATLNNKRILTEDDLSNIGGGGGGGTTITDYVSTTKTTTQSILGGLIIGAASISSPDMRGGRLMLIGSNNPLIGVQETGGTLFYFQSKGDTMFLGPTSSKALAFTGSTGAISMPNTLTVTGNVTAPTFVGALSGNATSATSAETVSSYTSASSDGSARPVWFAWNDGSKKPAYHTNFTYTVNTGTLAADNFSGHLVGNGVYYGICDTAKDTKAKTVTIDGFPSTLTAGLRVTIKFTNAAASSTMTLKVNNLEAKNICQYGTTASSSGTTTTGWRAGAVQTFTYDGTSWVREYWANTTYSNVSLGQGYATCSTAAATTAKTASLSSYVLAVGGIVSVKFTYGVPASASLNINSKGAKPIFYRGAAIKAGVIADGDVGTLMYDGTNYNLIAIDRGLDEGTLLPVTSSTMSIEPNKMYDFGTTTAVTVTLATPTNANIINNYMFQFTAHANGCTFTPPSGIKWANGISPTIEGGSTYQISILNNCGVWTKFA